MGARMLAAVLGLVGPGCGALVAEPPPGSDGTSTTTGAGDADSTTGEPVEPALCPSLAPATPALPLAAVIDSDTPALVWSDATVRALEAAEPPPYPGAGLSRFVVGHGFFATAYEWWPFAGDQTGGWELRIFDYDADLRSTFVDPGYQELDIRLGPMGEVAFQRSPLSGGGEATAHILLPSGELIGLPGFWPTGSPTPDGDVPGFFVGEGYSYEGQGWYHPQTGPGPVVPEPRYQKWDYLFHDVQYSLQEVEGQLQLVATAPSGITRTPLPTLELLPDHTLDVVQIKGGYLLLQDLLDERYYRLDLTGREAIEIPAALPAGWWAMDCYSPAPTLGNRGQVFRVVRNAERAQVSRLDLDSGTWTSVGRSITETDQVTVEAWGETVLIRSEAPGTTFCPVQPWEPATESILEGRHLQVVRPMDDSVVFLPPGTSWTIPTRNGLCVAYLDAIGEWEVMDVLTGESRRLGRTGQFQWLSAADG